MSEKRVLFWPYVRKSVIVHFESLLDTEFQKTWFEPEDDGKFCASLDFYVFDYLFDAPWAGLRREAYKAIDVTLYNEEEAEVISKYLDFYYKTFEGMMPDSYYINHPKWPELIERAKGIIDMMEANNKKYNFQKDLESWDEDDDNDTLPSAEEYRIMEEKTDERLRKYNEAKEDGKTIVR